MENTHITPDAVKSLSKGMSILRRLGTSLFLFSFVFTALLFGSWMYALPRLTRITLQGRTLDLAVVVPYEQQLRAQLMDIEAKRNALALPLHDAAYDALKRDAQCYPLLEDMEKAVAEAAERTAQGSAMFSSMTFDADGTLGLRGDIRNVGMRSMTVLAQFVEELGTLPFVASVTPPRFVRSEDAGIGHHSPFDLTLHLKPSDTCPIAVQ